MKEINIGILILPTDWAIGFVSLKYNDATIRGFFIGSIGIGVAVTYV